MDLPSPQFAQIRKNLPVSVNSHIFSDFVNEHSASKISFMFKPEHTSSRQLFPNMLPIETIKYKLIICQGVTEFF